MPNNAPPMEKFRSCYVINDFTKEKRADGGVVSCSSDDETVFASCDSTVATAEADQTFDEDNNNEVFTDDQMERNKTTTATSTCTTTSDTAVDSAPLVIAIMPYLLYTLSVQTAMDGLAPPKVHKRNSSIGSILHDIQDAGHDFHMYINEKATCLGDVLHLHPFDALPQWLQDNCFITHGHRPPMPNAKQCFRSIFSIHAETGNIWTHLIGAMLFLLITILFWVLPMRMFPLEQKLIMSAFFIGAIACLGLSAAFHTFSCHSQQIQSLFAKLDYVGISLLILGSFIPWLYYGFYCDPVMMAVYVSTISVITLLTIVVSLWERFSTPQCRPVRAFMFIAAGLSGVIPAIHLGVQYGGDVMMNKFHVHWLIVMAVLYIVGALLYAARVPERFRPGKFDIFCHSHQIFHLCVIAAALVHLYGICLNAYERREDCDGTNSTLLQNQSATTSDLINATAAV